MNSFTWGNDALTLWFSWDNDLPVCISEAKAGNVDVAFAHRIPLVELEVAGTGHWIACDRLIQTSLGADLRYVDHRESETNGIKRLDVTLADKKAGVEVTMTYRLPAGVPMFQSFATVKNISDNADKPLSVEQVTSFASAFGAPKGTRADLAKWSLIEGEYDWLAEGRWHETPLRDYFPVMAQELTDHDPRGEHSVVSTSTWSTGKHAPLAIAKSDEFKIAWLFQVEHNGAWRWEVGEDTEDAYVALSGPTSVNHGWCKNLMPGETFSTVPASVALAADFDGVIEAVTGYRRAMRLQPEHSDNARPKVIFNDYMNTIYGDPTTEKELPLIKAAAEVGIEIFCIDCGWYDETGNWWPTVGEWLPSKKRFPNGLKEVTDAIRNAGMVPGLWLEPEVIGVESPMAEKLPDSAFFMRNGHRIVEQQRYVLDLRDSAARKHLDSVVDRLVNDFGVGYFKMDYNVQPGMGSDVNSDSLGDGLLGHNRAYLDWIDGIHRRFPDLIIENCSSGGMREDFAQTSRFQVQSTSDQQDFRLYPAIAATAPMMVLPEQAGSWAYPQADMGVEESAVNINTTFLGRYFLSGYINRMSAEQRGLVERSIKAYKTEVQPMIAQSVPFWPMGLPGWDDKVLALGLRGTEYSLVTVWDRESEGKPVRLSLPQYAGRKVSIEPVFPVEGVDAWPVSWDAASGEATVSVPNGGQNSRTFKVTAHAE